MKRFINDKKLTLIVIFFFIVVFSFSIFISKGHYFCISNSPDQTGFVVSLKNFIENEGQIKNDIFLELNNKYDNLFGFRGMVIDNEGYLLPLKSILEIYVIGTLSILDNNIYYVLESIIPILFCIFIFIFVRKKGYNNLRVILPISLFFLFDMEVVFDKMFMFLSFIYFIKYLKSYDIRFLVILSLFFGVSIFARYDNIIFFIPIFTYLLILLISRLEFRRLSIFIILNSIFVGGIFYSNLEYYGGLLTFGYSHDLKSQVAYGINENLSSLEILFKKIKSISLPFGFHPEYFFKNFIIYVIKVYPLLFLLGIFGYLMFLNKTKFKFKYIVSILIFITFAYIIIFYGSNDHFWGNNTITKESSYVRYFSLIYLFLFLGLISFIYNELINKKRFVSFSIIALFFILSIGSYNYKKNVNVLYKKDIDNFFPSNSFIFSNMKDKFFIEGGYNVGVKSVYTSTNDIYFSKIYNVVKNEKGKFYYFKKDDYEEKEFINYFRKKGLGMRNSDSLGGFIEILNN